MSYFDIARRQREFLRGPAGPTISNLVEGLSSTGPTGPQGVKGDTGTIEYLDSPATTSSTTYNVKICSSNNSTGIAYLNRTRSDDDAYWMGRATSSITLIEVS